MLNLLMHDHVQAPPCAYEPDDANDEPSLGEEDDAPESDARTPAQVLDAIDDIRARLRALIADAERVILSLCAPMLPPPSSPRPGHVSPPFRPARPLTHGLDGIEYDPRLINNPAFARDGWDRLGMPKRGGVPASVRAVRALYAPYEPLPNVSGRDRRFRENELIVDVVINPDGEARPVNVIEVMQPRHLLGELFDYKPGVPDIGPVERKVLPLLLVEEPNALVKRKVAPKSTIYDIADKWRAPLEALQRDIAMIGPGGDLAARLKAYRDATTADGQTEYVRQAWFDYRVSHGYRARCADAFEVMAPRWFIRKLTD